MTRTTRSSFVAFLSLALVAASGGCTDRALVPQPGADSHGGSGSMDDEGDSATGGDLPLPEDLPCGETGSCEPDEACFEGICLADGPLRFSLSWHASTDLDLHVRAPDGTVISYLVPTSATGFLDIDDCPQQRCRDEHGPHVESVVFTEGATPGVYQAWVVNFDGLTEASFELEIASPDITRRRSTLPADSALASQVFEVAYR